MSALRIPISNAIEAARRLCWVKLAIRNWKLAIIWARQDSNLGPRDYESPALTAELQARFVSTVKHSEPPVTNLESAAALHVGERNQFAVGDLTTT
jgi:hypothetical protein